MAAAKRVFVDQAGGQQVVPAVGAHLDFLQGQPIAFVAEGPFPSRSQPCAAVALPALELSANTVPRGTEQGGSTRDDTSARTGLSQSADHVVDRVPVGEEIVIGPLRELRRRVDAIGVCDEL